MQVISRLGRQLQEAIACLERAGSSSALIGCERLHRSQDAATYVRGDERVDFLYASRPAARREPPGLVSPGTAGSPRTGSRRRDPLPP